MKIKIKLAAYDSYFGHKCEQMRGFTLRNFCRAHHRSHRSEADKFAVKARYVDEAENIDADANVDDGMLMPMLAQ